MSLTCEMSPPLSSSLQSDGHNGVNCRGRAINNLDRGEETQKSHWRVVVSPCHNIPCSVDIICPSAQRFQLELRQHTSAFYCPQSCKSQYFLCDESATRVASLKRIAPSPEQAYRTMAPTLPLDVSPSPHIKLCDTPPTLHGMHTSPLTPEQTFHSYSYGTGVWYATRAAARIYDPHMVYMWFSNERLDQDPTSA